MEYVSRCTLVGACCLGMGFRRMFSAPDCAAFDGCMFRVAEEGSNTVTVVNYNNNNNIFISRG